MNDAVSLRIFLVEDEMMVALDLEDMLSDLGHVVAASAMRIEAALELAREGTFDLAILDVNVAGTMSYPVAELLRSRGIPVVFSTGYDAGALPEAFRDAVTLQKPFRSRDLDRIIATVASR